MYEVSWSRWGETPDHSPHIFPEYLAALKFLQDEIDWYDPGGDPDLIEQMASAAVMLALTKEEKTLAFTIGDFSFWLLPLVDR